MNIDTRAVWTSVCGELEIALSGATFGWWIKPCSIKSVTDIDPERLIVELATPSAYHIKTIDERYYGQIKQALEKQLGKRVELALVIGGPTFAKATEGKANELVSSINGGLFAERRRETVETKGLYPRYTFDAFVVGNSNNLAYAAAKAVVAYPGVRHNPLFIWGGVGVGKTHLMQAVGHALAENGITKVTYLTSEQFTNDLVSSLRSKTVDAFKLKYRKVGALLVDDVQFFAGKEGTQEEFFHTFNELYMHGVQIVMTSDRKPQDIDKLEERLVSRFLGGLTVDIGLPDFEMRVAILTQKANALAISVDGQIINMIASNVVTNARELEGMFVRLVNQASLSGGIIDSVLVEKVLGVATKKEATRMRPLQIISLVAKQFDLKNKDIVGKSRKADLVLARHIAIYLLRDDLNMGLVKIGELFGGRDHTTIMHAAEKIKQEIEIDQIVRTKVMGLRQNMYLGN